MSISIKSHVCKFELRVLTYFFVSRRTGNKRDVVEIGCGENVPALKITQLGQTHISGSIKR